MIDSRHHVLHTRRLRSLGWLLVLLAGLAEASTTLAASEPSTEAVGCEIERATGPEKRAALLTVDDEPMSQDEVRSLAARGPDRPEISRNEVAADPQSYLDASKELAERWHAALWQLACWGSPLDREVLKDATRAMPQDPEPLYALVASGDPEGVSLLIERIDAAESGWDALLLSGFLLSIEHPSSVEAWFKTIRHEEFADDPSIAGAEAARVARVASKTSGDDAAGFAESSLALLDDHPDAYRPVVLKLLTEGARYPSLAVATCRALATAADSIDSGQDEIPKSLERRIEQTRDQLCSSASLGSQDSTEAPASQCDTSSHEPDSLR